MKLSELFSNLSFGVLSNLSIGGDGIGMVPSEQETRLTTFVNKALADIYSRFPILEKEVIVRLYDGKTLYPLMKIYADSDPTQVSQKYISDTVAEPFLEDVLKILEVYDELGLPISLNDTGADLSVFTPSLATLQVPFAASDNALFVIYRASHVPLVPGNTDQEVTVPGILQEAFEHRIAYQVMSPMNGQEHAAKAAEHLARYEQICTNIERNDLLQTSQSGNHTKLTDRGFV